MEVFNFMDILSERELLGCLTRVTARLGKLFQYIIDSRKAEISLHIFLRLDAGAHLRIAYQLAC